MSRRLHPTLADYVIVAINPALIMVLIGSLVYFLLEMFYQGQYPARLHYCLTWFIFGAVLVSRISMEEGWDHAAPFGGALAVVIVLALHRFVSYDGTNLAQIGWLINYGLIALIWWCAHRLTWDCTLIDESQDTSGEGLLQTVGLDSHGGKSEAAATADKSEAESSRRAVSGSKRLPNAADDELPAITVANDAPSVASRAAKITGKTSWWQQFVERRRRPHAPGVWIVYFSLAALPLFGLGQAFTPAANTGSRRYAFLLLCIYVACGLGLLMTTSFLGLRRYLRRRKLEMPTAMAGTWLATGAVLIVGLLLFSALLPRPNAEYAISQLPVGATSVERESSRLAVGKEGTKDDQAESKPSQDGESESGESGESSSNKPSDSASDSDSAKNSDSDSKQDPNSDNAQQREEQQSESRDGSQSDSAAKPNESPQSTPPVQPPDITFITFLGFEIIAIVKWVFYGALILAAAWWSWRHRSELLAWLVGLLTAWRDFWHNLFGRRRELPETIQIAPIRRSFSEYTDPFAAGVAGRYPPEELVRYSFEAFEAWARDQGWPRDTDQTAYEFARAIGTHAPNIAAPARTLAELYSRAAYAPGTLPVTSAEHLRSLWQSMKAPQLVA